MVQQAIFQQMLKGAKFVDLTELKQEKLEKPTKNSPDLIEKVV